MVTLASELLDQVLRDGEGGLRPVLSHPPAILKSSNDIRILTRRIFAEYPTHGFARAHILRSLSTLLLGLVAREMAGSESGELRPDTRLQRRFEALIEARYRIIWAWRTMPVNWP